MNNFAANEICVFDKHQDYLKVQARKHFPSHVFPASLLLLRLEEATCTTRSGILNLLFFDQRVQDECHAAGKFFDLVFGRRKSKLVDGFLEDFLAGLMLIR